MGALIRLVCEHLEEQRIFRLATKRGMASFGAGSSDRRAVADCEVVAAQLSAATGHDDAPRELVDVILDRYAEGAARL